MMRRMPAADVQKLVDEWRTRKVNAPLAMVSGLLQRSGKMPHWCKMVFRQKTPTVALKPAHPICCCLVANTVGELENPSV